MSKIEVGEYVRTKDGRIAQIKSIDYEAGIYRFDRIIYINDFRMKEDVLYNNEMFKKLIANHSKQLIDLIENKDILKLKASDNKEVFFIGIDEDTPDIKYKELIENIENGENELLEILTHEQFEANCYKVGGE
jgi:hypothetical protein